MGWEKEIGRGAGECLRACMHAGKVYLCEELEALAAEANHIHDQRVRRQGVEHVDVVKEVLSDLST